jgi:hypothetical protein
MWLIPLITGGLISKGVNLAYEILLKLISLIFYLASEYWGRWVLAAAIVACGLAYGRWHYIEQGRAREASFRELVVDAELRSRCEARGGTVINKPNRESWLPEGWP